MPTTDHLEIETKYVLDGPLPDLAGLPGVAEVVDLGTQQLDATYLDTADHSLRAAGVVLRRRTGGDDEGWHLKLPQADGRLEVQRPLGKGTRAPHELTDLVHQVRHGRPVHPVLRLHTQRRIVRLLDDAGETLAEVADDTVTARPGGPPPGAPSSRTTRAGRRDSDKADVAAWREVEVELVDGDDELADAVGQRLRQAGASVPDWPSKYAHAVDVLGLAAPSGGGDRRAGGAGEAGVATSGAHPGRTAPAVDVVVAHLRGGLATLVALDPLVRLDEPDALHRMRVTTRRLRSVLASTHRLLDDDRVAALRNELRWAGQVLGEARDLEVVRDRLVSDLADLPPEQVVGPVADRLAADLGGAHLRAHERVVTALSGRRYLRLRDALDDLVDNPPVGSRPDDRASAALPRLLERDLRRVRRAWEAAHAAEDADDREAAAHELRKAAKRTRYSAEAWAPVVRHGTKRLARQMRTVHDRLGLHLDDLLVREHLLHLADSARAAGEDTFTYGVLLGRTEEAATDEALTDVSPVVSGARAPRARR